MHETLPQDLHIDTRELYKFDNILEFIHELTGNYIHTRIALLLLDIHGEVCWHCSDKKHVPMVHELTTDQFKDKFVLTQNGKCPRCGRTMFDMLRENLWTAPSKACLMLGQRSGKDWALALAMLYAEHKLQVLERGNMRVTPSQYYYGNDSLELVCSVVGSKHEIESTLGYCMYTLRGNSPWFKLYFEILDMYEAKHGVKLYTNTKHLVQYHNNVSVYGELPEAYRELRGKTRFMTVFPEVSWAQDKDGNTLDMHKPMEAIVISHKTMQNAFRNSVVQYSHAPVPLVLTATSPRDASDVAHTLEKESYFDRSVYFARHPNWEVNPTYSEAEIMSLPGSEAQKLRDFACIV